jgi:hypothetical protein
VVLFFLKKEPKTLALRGFNSLKRSLLTFREAELRGLGLAPVKHPCCGFLFKKRTKNISPAGLQLVGTYISASDIYKPFD